MALLAIPFLEDVDEEVELLVLLEQGVGVELAQLETRVVLVLEEWLDVLLQAGVRHDCLQGRAHVSIEYYIKNRVFLDS